MPLDNRTNNILKNLEQHLEIEKKFGIEGFILDSAPSTDKHGSMETVIEEISKCKKCPLYKTRKNVVCGEGNLSADIIFVGEAPGEDEDSSGRPFVGRAGKLLTQIIEAMGYKRENVYIANVLKCRPPLNRMPALEEIQACCGFLKRQIAIIKPRVICTLGRFANFALINKTQPLKELRANVYLYEDIKVIPTFHPAYLLRNPAEKKAAWQDFKKALQIIKGES